MRYFFGLSILALLSTGCGYIPFSSGELNGEVTPVPQTWSNVASADIIQFETRPADPYSVNLWVLGMERATIPNGTARVPQQESES